MALRVLKNACLTFIVRSGKSKNFILKNHMEIGFFVTTNLDLFCPPPPSLAGLYLLRPAVAPNIFLHSNVLYSNIECVTGGGGVKTTGGQNRFTPKIYVNMGTL